MLTRLRSLCLLVFFASALSTIVHASSSGDEPLDVGAAAFYAIGDNSNDPNSASIGLLKYSKGARLEYIRDFFICLCTAILFPLKRLFKTLICFNCDVRCLFLCLAAVST